MGEERTWGAVEPRLWVADLWEQVTWEPGTKYSATVRNHYFKNDVLFGNNTTTLRMFGSSEQCACVEGKRFNRGSPCGSRGGSIQSQGHPPIILALVKGAGPKEQDPGGKI